MLRRWLHPLGCLVLGSGLVGVSCHPLSNDCTFLLTCGGGQNLGGEAGAPSGGADTGGTGGSGGTPSGGAGGTGGIGGASTGGLGGLGGDGGAAPTECGDVTCTPEAPYCDDGSQTCAECLEDTHCDGAVCKDATLTCVECELSDDCQEPSASQCIDDACESCSQDEHCTHLTATPTCDAENGTCVECLDESACEGFVCAPETHTCTDRLARSLFACEACDHDLDCEEGQLCVPQSYDDGSGAELIGNFCTWTKEGRVGSGDCDPDGKPFAYETPGLVQSVDGASAVLCALRTTTCPAFVQHSQAVSGCASASDDAACGVEGIDDGLCRLNTGGNPRCTYPCLSNADCKSGSTCTVGGYCTL